MSVGQIYIWEKITRRFLLKRPNSSVMHGIYSQQIPAATQGE
jgi:hypothetical protein